MMGVSSGQTEGSKIFEFPIRTSIVPYRSCATAHFLRASEVDHSKSNAHAERDGPSREVSNHVNRSSDVKSPYQRSIGVTTRSITTTTDATWCFSAHSGRRFGGWLDTMVCSIDTLALRHGEHTAD